MFVYLSTMHSRGMREIIETKRHGVPHMYALSHNFCLFVVDNECGRQPHADVSLLSAIITRI